MATGLTRNKNLSEKNLNLKNALQKLYAPGIENDLELFSLTSDIESVITSGPESDRTSQITGLKTEYIKTVSGQSVPRTKFLTKYFTYTDGNKVYFKEFDFITGPNPNSKQPIKSINGAVVNTSLYSGGNGYYFLDAEDNPLDLGTSQNITINNVKLRGKTSKSESAVCDLVLAPGEILGTEGTYSNQESQGLGSVITVNIKHDFKTGDSIYFTPTSGIGVEAQYAIITVIDNNTIEFLSITSFANQNETCVITPADELERFTPGIYTRYKIIGVFVTEPGEEYLESERLEVIPGDVEYEGILIKLRKQTGILYSGTSEILQSDQYYYEVRGSDLDGFYLIDPADGGYMFLDINTPDAGFNQNALGAIDIRRSDSISGENFSYFKFIQSPVYLRGFVDAYTAGTQSISAEINRISTVGYNTLNTIKLQIQNTKKPTLSSSVENELGYNINSFSGYDGVFWQRVIVRDQDYLLDPNNGVTSALLKENVSNFTLPNGVKAPGLYLIFGDKYVRAFSTTDKPFLTLSALGAINPNIYGGGDKSISAEDSQNQGISWYGYNSVIGELAQRISSNGINGALYYHKVEPPTVQNVRVTINATQQNVYLVPLFNLI